MTETKFKSTPWKVYQNDFTTAWISNSEDVTVALAFKDSVEHAHLIAAAPELYEALDDLIIWFWSEHGDSDRLQDGIKALAKARGETK